MRPPCSCVMLFIQFSVNASVSPGSVSPGSRGLQRTLRCSQRRLLTRLAALLVLSGFKISRSTCCKNKTLITAVAAEQGVREGLLTLDYVMDTMRVGVVGCTSISTLQSLGVPLERCLSHELFHRIAALIPSEQLRLSHAGAVAHMVAHVLRRCTWIVKVADTHGADKRVGGNDHYPPSARAKRFTAF
jgi:hypothetical protein